MCETSCSVVYAFDVSHDEYEHKGGQSKEKSLYRMYDYLQVGGTFLMPGSVPHGRKMSHIYVSRYFCDIVMNISQHVFFLFNSRGDVLQCHPSP